MKEKFSSRGRSSAVFSILAVMLLGASVAVAAPQPDLKLTITDSPDPVSVGELLTYRATITNSGTATATSVSLVSTLSSNLTYFSATVSQGTFTQSASSVTCNVGTLVVGAGAVVTIKATPGSYGTATNSAVVTETQTDLNPADNSAKAATIVAPLTFYPGPDLNVPRGYHTATLLPNGKVLIAGGVNAMTSAELYDPATKTFTVTGSMNVGRNMHAATLLNDGTVLITGGNTPGLPYSAEIYNPATGLFTVVSNMNYSHVMHATAVLADGRVLVDGFYPEIYNPVTHTFTNVTGTIAPATYRSAFRLADGKIILPGGSQNDGFNALAFSEYYDPALNHFVALPDMPHSHCIYGCAQLLDGRYLIAAGNSYVQYAELFDTNSMSFTPVTNTLLAIHYFACANRLPDGKVLVSGYSSQTDMFDPATTKFSRGVDMLYQRLWHTSTTLQDGSVLEVGGTVPGFGMYLGSSEIYDPARSKVPPMVSITNATVLEGGSGTTNCNFQLTLSSPMGAPVYVNYTTGDDSAVAGQDYVGTNDTVIFPAGTTNLTLSVPVFNNHNYQLDKDFTVSLVGSTNAIINTLLATATGTIQNTNPQTIIMVSSPVVVEGNVRTTNLDFNVSLNGSSYVPVSVNFATVNGSAVAGQDYVATNGTLNFDPGVTNLIVSVPAKGDAQVEPDETFSFTLNSPTNATLGANGTGTILNDDGFVGMMDHFEFAPLNLPVYGTIPFPVTLTARDAFNNVVTNFNGLVTLSGSSTNRPSYSFSFEEGDFSIWTPLNNGGVPGPYTLSRFDVNGDGMPSIAFNLLPDSADGVTTTVALQAGVTYLVTADIALMDTSGGGTPPQATTHIRIGGVDLKSFGFPGGITPTSFGYTNTYRTNLSSTFTPVTNGQYVVTVLMDRIWPQWDSIRTFIDDIKIAAPGLVPGHLGYFTNGVWSGNVTASGAITNYILHVDDEAGHVGDTAPFAVVGYSDVAVQTSILSGTPRVGTNLTYSLLVSNFGPGTATAVVVTNNLPPNSTFVSAISTAGTCAVSNGIVFCSLGAMASNQTATVTITTVPLLPGTFTNVAGAWSSDYDPNVTNNLASTAMTINPPQIFVSSTTVVERTGTTTNAVFVVSIGTPFLQTIDVNYATSSGQVFTTPGQDYVPTSGHLTFPPGVSNQTVTVAVLDDLINEPNEAFLLVLSNPTNAQVGGFGTCTIVDNFDPLPLISIADAAVVEGNSGTTNLVFNVTLDRPSGNTIRVNYAASNLTASVTADLANSSFGALSIQPNVTNATITVSVRGDTVKEADETFTMTLSNPVGGVIQRAQAIGTIINDDTAAGLFDHFDWSVVPSQVYANLAFAVTLTARDAYGAAFTGGLPSPVSLTMSQNGTNFFTLTPSSVGTGSFVNGVWSGTLSINTSKTNVVLRADDGLQHVGVSNPFDVLAANALVLTLPVGTNENAGVWLNAGKVRLPSATGSPVTVNLSSSDTTAVTVPASVIVPAGQSNATFNLTLVDDAILDGTQTATITASASGYAGTSSPFAVYDNETATLLVGAPSSILESSAPAQGTVTISAAPASAMFVTLTSSDPNRIQVPATLSFAVGQTNKTFTITNVNDQILQGPTNITITAHVQNWTDGSTNFTLLDDETNALAFQFTGGGAVYPEGTIWVTNATLRLGGSVGTNVTVNLFSSNTNAVIVPASVMIPAGSNTVPLNLTIVDDLLTNGTHFATLTATAAGFSNATAQVSVTDNDLHHFNFSAIASPQQGSVAFTVTITARDINDVLMTGYTSYVLFSAQDMFGNPATVSPASVTVANGTWTGSLTIPTWEYSGLKLIATDTDGHGSMSSAFDLLAPTVFIVNNLANGDIAYSAAARLLYASSSTAGTLTPINPFSGTVGIPITITNSAGTNLSGRLCAGDGGQYIFAVMAGPTNHIAQFDVNSQNVLGWTLGGETVSDLTPVLGSPATVAVSWRNGNGSPHYGGLYIYDNGIARSNAFTTVFGTGPDLIEPSLKTNILYGYNNETSPSSTYVLNVDASGVTSIGSWGSLGIFNVDFMCRAGLNFINTGQIFDPTRSLQIGTFANTPVSDDPPSGRYYLATVGAVTAYDQNTLLPVGVTALPGVTTATGGFQRFGTNGFALRVGSSKVALIRTPLISTGPATDLRLTASVPLLPPAVGSVASYTLTVSNAGPNAAQNVLLSQTLPANSSFVSASSTSGSNTLSGSGLLSSLLAIPAGGSASVTVNLQTAKPGLLCSIASVTSDALDPNLSNNVVKLEVPVAAPSSRDTVVEEYLPTSDIAWDKFSGRIFASIPNSDWLLGNNLVGLDTATGNFDPLIPAAGFDPGQLAISGDGQYLYAGVYGDGSVQRVVLSSRTTDLKFVTGFGGPTDMAALPGNPQTVAMTIGTVLAVYDNGVMRSNVVGSGPYGSAYYLAVGATNLLYEGMPTELRRISLDSSGATLLGTSEGLINNFDRQIKFDAGRLYSAGGSVIDPEAQVLVTNLNYGGLSVPDSHAGKVFYLTISGSIGTLHAVGISNFVEYGSVTIPNVSGTPSSLIRWGGDGLAFRTSANQLFLVRTTLADDTDNDGLADSWEMASFGSLNAVGGNPADDPDHDGMSNLAEFRAGTNPNDPNSRLRLTGIGRQGNAMQLNWQGGTNVFYRIQRASSLTGPWVDIYTNPPGATPAGFFVDPTAPAAVGYYRLSTGP